MPDFEYQPIFELGPDETDYRHLTSEHVSTFDIKGRNVIEVASEGLELIAKEAMGDMAHFLRTGHLAQLRKICDDPEASENDCFVALELL